MKSQFRHTILLGLMLVTAFVSLVPTSVFAAGASAYLTPASGTAQIGSSFTISVDGQLGAYWWGGGPSSANGTITFPANLLKVTAYDDNTNATFPYSHTTVDNSGGALTFSQSTAAWTYTNANSNAHLLTITFQALASGTANVQFSSMSYSTGSAATTGGTYTIPAPPSPSPSPTPTPKPSTTPTATPKPKPSSTPSPTPTPSVEETPAPTSNSDGGLKISDVKVTADRTTNALAWSLNNAETTQTVSYGTAKDKLGDAGSVTKLDDGTYKLTLNDLRPGTLYYYLIKAMTADGLQGATYGGTFTTRGYPVALTIQQGGLLLPGAKVTIGGRSFVADKDARIMTELPDGTITAAIVASDSSKSQSVNFVVKKVTVPTSGNPETQAFTLNIPAETTASHATTSLLPAIIGGAVASLALIGGGVGFLLIRKRRMETEQPLDVDTGQLAQTYGDRITRPLSNTPEPNLEADYANPLAQSTFSNTPADDQQPTAAMPEQEVVAVPPVQAPLPQPQQPEAAFDPASLPLPTPAENSPEAAPVAADASPPVDSELLGQEINQVEASEQPASDEPSAVYDEATGELAIIHHHQDPAPALVAPPPPTTSPQSLTPPQQGLPA
jgi:hypothetical protein